MLRHFTDEQAAEIRSELRLYLRPYRLRFYFVLALVMLTAAAGVYENGQQSDRIAIEGRTLAEQTHRLALQNCSTLNSGRAAIKTTIDEILQLSVSARAGHETPQQHRRGVAFQRRVARRLRRDLAPRSCTIKGG